MRVAKEIVPLTGLRGVAAIYVMIFHYFIGLPFSNPATTFLAHGYLAVDLFFCLSGFVMALNYGQMFASGCSKDIYLRFLGRRFARIYPLYSAGTIVGFFLVIEGWLDTPQFGRLSTTLALNLTMVQAWGFGQSIDGPGWSISAEWAAYLLFPLLLGPTLFSGPLLACVSALICAGVLGTLTALPASYVHNPTPKALLDLHNSWLAFPVMRCLPEFVLGVLAYRYSMTAQGRAVGSSRWVSPVVSLTVLALMTVPGTDLVVVLLFSPLLVSLTSLSHLPGRILASPLAELAGRLSYSIYLVHGLMFGVLKWIHGRIDTLGLAHAQTYAAMVCIPLTFPVAFLCYKFIEVPGRRWLRFLFQQKSVEQSDRPSHSSGGSMTA